MDYAVGDRIIVSHGIGDETRFYAAQVVSFAVAQCDLGITANIHASVKFDAPARTVQARCKRQSNRCQDARLPAAVGAVQDGQLRVQGQCERLDPPVFLDNHRADLHPALARTFGVVNNTRSAVSTRLGFFRCIAIPSQ